MALSSSYQISVASGSWTLIAQSAIGNANLAYRGFTATGPVSAKFRSYVSPTLAVGDPAAGQFRHSYTTSPADRTAVVVDSPEIYTGYVWLECLQSSGSTQTFDGFLAGGAT